MTELIRFKVNIHKCIEGIDLLAQHKPNITQYYVCKIFYFADKEHLMDWGRPISGDKFVAMQHGPVPSYIYDLIKDTDTEPDEVVDLFNSRINVRRVNNKIHLSSKGTENFSHLSGTDKEYLLDALSKYGNMSFQRVKEITHQDKAYIDAWEKSGSNNELDLSLWFSGSEWNGINAVEQLKEISNYHLKA